MGELTISQSELLCEIRRIPLTGEFEDGSAVRIFTTLKLIDDYSCKMIYIISKLRLIHIMKSVDKSREAATYGKRPPDSVNGLLHGIELAEGSSVMLECNISISEGLVNDAMKIVKKFMWHFVG